MLDSLSPPPATRRRGSSVGNIHLGDTSSPAFSTMQRRASSRKRSDARLHQISIKLGLDSDWASVLWIAFRELCLRQTWIIPGLVVVATVGLYVILSPGLYIHDILGRGIVLSYHVPGTNQYGKGVNDFYFVFYYSLFFTFLREFVMCCFLRPLAAYCGITREAKQKRFMEQTYAIFYTGCLGPFGLWIMLGLPIWYYNTTEFYVTYPHFTHSFLFKLYYLGQAAYWVQQTIVLSLQLEKPRKDFQELVFHHIVTIALIWCLYRFHFTWMGIAIYITMDISDFFLSISKTLNYLDSPMTIPALSVFVVSWIYFRHYLNLKILYSVLTEFRTVGEWELNWDTQQDKCYISQPTVFFLIGALQLVNAYWLFLIFRIIYRYVTGGIAKDERSDDEEEEEEEEQEKKNQ